jgi:hypothetical protein
MGKVVDMIEQSCDRNKLRRAVEIPCDIVTRHIDEPLMYWATDLTSDGIWLETNFPMRAGERVVVCLKPAIFWRSRELMLFAEVVRSASVVSRSEQACGMGLIFTDIDRHEQRALDGWLRGRPPRLPRRRRRSPQLQARLPNSRSWPREYAPPLA